MRTSKKEVTDVGQNDGSDDDSSDDDDVNGQSLLGSAEQNTGLHGNHFRTCYQKALSVCSQTFSANNGGDVILEVIPSCIGYLATYCSILADSKTAREIWTHLQKVLHSLHGSVSQSLEGLLLLTLSVMAADDMEAVLRELISSVVSCLFTLPFRNYA